MLQIKNLSITHKKDLRPLLDHFTFSLNSGDKAVIISEEGNGKSTLLKLIYDSRLVDSYVEYTGEILTQGTLMGYLPQEFPPEYKEQTIYTYCTSIPAFSDRNPGELAAIAARLRLPKDIFYSDQLCGTLSGGEKVKLQIAGLQMCQPDIYLLDEPSNDIDIETLEWLEQFINTCGKPVLYVSHDETLIEHTANVIIHLEQIMRKTQPRHTIVRMPYREYISNREASFLRQEQQAQNERREYRKKMERFRQIEQKVESQQNNISRQDPFTAKLLKKKMKAVKAQEHRFEREKEDMTVLARPDLKAAYMPQDYEELLNLEQNPVDFLSSRGDKEERTTIRTYLGSMRYTADEMSHAIRELSGGQKAKLLFLKMSLDGCNVLILDEPTRNFSPLSGPVIRQVLKEYPGAIISISHDRKYLEEVVDTTYELTEQGLVKRN